MTSFLKIQLFTLFIILLLNLSNSQDITFSQEAGFYPNQFSLTLTSSDGSKIYYTTDGSDPTSSKTAKEYTNPIEVKDRSSEPNIYCEYQEDENSAT
jgi:hypothetical protein